MPGVIFGAFSFDPERLELSRHGIPIKLAPQPAQVLKLLLQNPGEVVARERIREALWPAGTHVEFELGLNTAVNRLRRVLNDSADRPRYIETLPRAGYRFVAPVVRPAEAAVTTEIQTPPAMDVEPAVVVPEPVVAAHPQRWLSMRYARLGLGLAGAVVAGVLLWRMLPGARTVQKTTGERLEIPISLVAGATMIDIALSPVGDHVVYAVAEPTRRVAYRRFFQENFSRKVEGSEDVWRVCFSPNGNELGILTETEIRIVSPDGRRRKIADLPTDGKDTAVWSPDGHIYYTLGAGLSAGVWKVRDDGSEPPVRVLSPLVTPRGVQYPILQGMAGGPSQMLYTLHNGPRQNELHVMSVESGGNVTTHMVRDPGSGGVYGAGMLVYEDNGQLVAEPMNPAHLQQPQHNPTTRITLSDEMPESKGWSGPMAALNEAGTLAFVRGQVRDVRKIVRVDVASGAQSMAPLPLAEYEQIRVSPVDPEVAAVVIRRTADKRVVELVNLTTGQAMSTIVETSSRTPRVAWTPGGKTLVISSNKDNGEFVNLYEVDVADPGRMRRLTEQPLFGQFPISVSGSGKFLFYVEGTHPKTKGDLKWIALPGGGAAGTDGVAAAPIAPVNDLVATPAWDVDAVLSPDGKQVAYASDESGKMMVYVKPFPAGTSRVLTTGRGPMFLNGGRDILFVVENRFAMVPAGGGPVRVVAEGPGSRYDVWTRSFDVTADGKAIFAIVRVPPAPATRMLEVVRNVAVEYSRQTR